MTTATTNTALSHVATANFRVWVAEIITALVTTCGMTQTTDTGQINTATVSKPAINTSAGFVILRFNDTAQSTSPIFIKLEFGTGSSTNNPMMWVTAASSTNGAGTLTGSLLTNRRAICADTSPSSTVTNYILRACYNATYGVAWLEWKIASTGVAVTPMGGFLVGRSNDSSGNPTTDAAYVITASSTTTGTTSPGNLEVMSYLSSGVFPNVGGTITDSTDWIYMPLTGVLNGTAIQGSNTQLGMAFYMTPNLELNAHACSAFPGDIGMGTTFVTALVGTTTKTFIQCGSMWGQAIFQSSQGGHCLLWQ